MAKLNILPVPTFARLGVNYAERDITAFGRKDIAVPDGAEQHIIQNISSDIETNVAVGSGAKLKLVQVFDGRTRCAAILRTVLADNAEFELIQLYLGGDTVSEAVTELNGYKAAFTADIGYNIGNGGGLDLNIVSVHHGRRSTSDITAGGVLRENAVKTFKGTIDFKTGAAGAVGNEKEDVILMSGDVCNKTVPVILCAEEDVVGNHGATIGRIDESHIFYMKSRGIPEEKIYELITRSKLARVIGKIGDEQEEKRICSALGWGDELE